jgi:hypothetical protein
MRIPALLIGALFSCQLQAQQVADTTYLPEIARPAYGRGGGPVVFIDEGHHNFHTKDGRYRAFADLLARDGYRVRAYGEAFDRGSLEEGDILVISNALHERNAEDWYLPTPSAFSPIEIEVVTGWVLDGGSLFLIADHMPMAGASEALAAAFGFEFTNGFVFDTLARGPAFFSLEDGTLHESVLTRGRGGGENVERIATFTGQAFRIPNDATPVLTFSSRYVNMLPDTAWVFDASTEMYNAEGWSQGAFRKYGRGRVVVFGEAAMFTAQLAGPDRIRIGMNSPVAPENHRLLLNIIHWLDGRLD